MTGEADDLHITHRLAAIRTRNIKFLMGSCEENEKANPIIKRFLVVEVLLHFANLNGNYSSSAPWTSIKWSRRWDKPKLWDAHLISEIYRWPLSASSNQCLQFPPMGRLADIISSSRDSLAAAFDTPLSFYRLLIAERNFKVKRK